MNIQFNWYDLWIGAYYDRKARVWYVCPLPTIVISIPLGPVRCRVCGKVIDREDEYSTWKHANGLNSATPVLHWAHPRKKLIHPFL